MRPNTSRAADCSLVLGFATLASRVPVGDCLENQHFAANGDAQQHTTGGLLVWRKSDNWTAFTDGFRTWVDGPAGVEQRLNSQRLRFESDYWPFAVKADVSFAPFPDEEQIARVSLAQVPLIAPKVLTKDYLGPEFISAFEARYPGVLDPVMNYVASKPLMEHMDNMESIVKGPTPYAPDGTTDWVLLGNDKTVIVYNPAFFYVAVDPQFRLSALDRASISLKELVGDAVVYALRERMHYGDAKARYVITEYISYDAELQSNLRYNQEHTWFLLGDAEQTLGQEQLIARLKGH